MYDKLLKAIVLALPPLHVQSTERQITSVVLTPHCSPCCLLIKISSLPPPPSPTQALFAMISLQVREGREGGREEGDSASCITQLEGISGPVSTPSPSPQRLGWQ